MRLERRYSSAEEARRLWQALAADHPSFVRGGTDGPTLRVEIAGPTAASVRASADDLLACLIAAEAAGRSGKGRTAPAPP